MSKNQKIAIVVAIIAIVIIIIAIVVNKKDNTKSENSIVDNSIEVEAVEREDRIETAINSTIAKIENAGMTAIKQSAVTLGEASGYNYSIDGTMVGIYYLEPSKLAQIAKTDANSGETTITIDGQTKNALVYNNIFILNCNSTTLKEKLDSVLGQNNRI